MDEKQIQKIADEVKETIIKARAEILKIDEGKPSSAIALKVSSAQKKLEKVIKDCETISDECNKIIFDAKIKEMLSDSEGRNKLGKFLDENEKKAEEKTEEKKKE